MALPAALQGNQEDQQALSARLAEVEAREVELVAELKEVRAEKEELSAALARQEVAALDATGLQFTVSGGAEAVPILSNLGGTGIGYLNDGDEISVMRWQLGHWHLVHDAKEAVVSDIFTLSQDTSIQRALEELKERAKEKNRAGLEAYLAGSTPELRFLLSGVSDAPLRRDLLSSESIATLGAGNEISVLGWTKDHWRVSFQGQEGYVSDSTGLTLDFKTNQALRVMRVKSSMREAEVAKSEEREAEKRVALESTGGHPIQIVHLGVSSPNSAGGVDAQMSFRALIPDKVIKYIHFTQTPYNAVGDAVRGRHKVPPTKSSYTGPVTVDDGVVAVAAEALWYNHTIRCVILNRIDVEYMDGSKYTYVKELPKILHPDVRNKC